MLTLNMITHLRDKKEYLDITHITNSMIPGFIRGCFKEQEHARMAMLLLLYAIMYTEDRYDEVIPVEAIRRMQQIFNSGVGNVNTCSGRKIALLMWHIFSRPVLMYLINTVNRLHAQPLPSE